MIDKKKKMHYYNPRKSGIGFWDIFTITVIATIAGLAMGLLFAPESGLKTRKKLNNMIKEALARGKFALLEARVMGEEILEKSIEKAEKVSSKVKNKK
ncbi:MAG: YtxH domain-containing protein [Actinobacteria bacterium]|nr:YtxH domain-containing protein [Actinomycetota bacterium]